MNIGIGVLWIIIIIVPVVLVIPWMELLDTFFHESGHALCASFFDRKQRIKVIMRDEKSKWNVEFKLRNIIYEVNCLNARGKAITEFENISRFSLGQVRAIGSAGILLAGISFFLYTLISSLLMYILIFKNSFWIIFHLSVGIFVYIIIVFSSIIRALIRFKRNSNE